MISQLYELKMNAPAGPIGAESCEFAGLMSGAFCRPPEVLGGVTLARWGKRRRRTLYDMFSPQITSRVLCCHSNVAQLTTLAGNYD